MRRMKSNVVSTSFTRIRRAAEHEREFRARCRSSRIRRASSSVSAADDFPPLFICASVASAPDSAPENTIFRPERAIASHVASLYCISVSTRPSAPPAQPEAGDALGELRGARLGDEEVHVVHLHGVDAVGGDQMAHHALEPRRRLRQPAPVRHRDDRAEAAGERAAERRVVRDRPLAEVVRVDVARHVDAVVRQLRQVVEVGQRLDRVVDDVAPTCLPAHRPTAFHDRPPTLFSTPPRPQDVDQLQERALALRADHEVDVRRAQHRVRVLRREVAAPHDRHVRQRRLHARADGDRLRQLRSRHHGDGEQRDLRPRRGGQPGDDLGRRIGNDVAVDERPRLGVSDRLERGPPSSTAASDISDSGSGCFPGVVEIGLKRTIIAPPTGRTRPARDAAARARRRGAAASRADRATARTAAAAPAARRPASRERQVPAPGWTTSVSRTRPEAPQRRRPSRPSRRRGTSASPSRRARRPARAGGARARAWRAVSAA